MLPTRVLTRAALGGRLVHGVLELSDAADHVPKFGPHEEAAAVPARPGALQDGLEEKR